MTSSNNKLLGPWRRLFQWFASLLILLIPWIHFNGVSLLRIDFPTLSLHFFGTILRIEELYLMLFFSLAFALLFLLVTLMFGRVWCGWACPQTTLSDLAEWAAQRLGLVTSEFRIAGSFLRKLCLHAFFLLIALLVGSNLLWYFVPPQVFFIRLFDLSLHPVALGFLLITVATIYLDLAFLRRLVCRDFCPYGRFQTVLADPATLALSLPASEARRCIKCNSCVRACPMEIDIRNGFQIECINCGRCLDACRQVMSRRDEPGLIGYHFGSAAQNWRDLLNPRTLILAIGFLALTGLLIGSVMLRTEATLKVALSHQVSSRLLADGSQATFFNAWLNNRTTTQALYSITAFDDANQNELVLKGPVQEIRLNAGENRKVDFVLVTPSSETEIRVKFRLTGNDGQTLSTSTARVNARQRKNR